MIIQCPECDSRFRVPDEKIKPGGIKVRCSKCKAVFKVPREDRRFGKADEEAPPEAPESPSTADPFAMEDPFGQTVAPFGDGGGAFAPYTDEDSKEDPFEEEHSPEAFVSENPFDREDPFAMTAFAPDDVGGDSGSLDFDLDPGGDDEVGDATGGDPFERDDPFASTAYGFAKKSPLLDGESGAFEISHFGDDSVAPMMELELNNAGGGGGHYTAGGIEDDNAISMLGDPSRAQMMMDAMPESTDIDGGMLGDPQRAQMMLDPLDHGAGHGGGGFYDDGPGDQNYFDDAGGGDIDLEIDDRPRGQPARKPRATPPKRRRSPAPIDDKEPDWPDAGPPEKPIAVPSHVIPASKQVAEVPDGGVGILQGIANFILILFVIAACLLGYVSMMNDWMLDFRSLGDMTAEAFGKGEYIPRHLRQTPETEEAPAPKAKPKVVIDGLEQVYYPNSEGTQLFVVEGKVVNQSDDDIHKISLQGEVFDEAGESIGAQVGPAGRSLTEDELMDVVDKEALGKAYALVEKDAAELTLKRGQALKFTLVFLGLPGEITDKRTFKIKLGGFDKVGEEKKKKPPRKKKKPARKDGDKPPGEKKSRKGR